MQTDTVRDRSGGGRLALVSRLIQDVLAAVSATGHRPAVLDCGGGSGTFAVPSAQSGAEVTVLDISADALATLQRRAAEAGVTDSIHPVQGDVETLSSLVRPGSFDLVLAHGILDAVDSPERVLAAMAETVRPGGVVSVLVANPLAGVLGRALAGEPAAALRELRALDSGDTRFGPDTVAELCSGAGLVVESRHGVGVFSDLVPGASLDAPGARDALAQLDLESAARSPFAELAGRVHLLARRPDHGT